MGRGSKDTLILKLHITKHWIMDRRPIRAWRFTRL